MFVDKQEEPDRTGQQIIEIRVPSTGEFESVSTEDHLAAEVLIPIPDSVDDVELASLPIVHAVRGDEVQNESVSSEAEARFAFDPFDYESDGPIPVMPTLPIIKAKAMTDRVVAREKRGDHYAWRLLPVPYPAEGNIPSTQHGLSEARPSVDQPESQNSDSVTSEVAHEFTVPVPMESALPSEEPATYSHGPTVFENLPSQRSKPSIESWTETEVVTAEADVHGDCFFAQAGDVIKVDGNQGFDHIDLRSYSIDDATFQRGSILLHSKIESSEEGERLPDPITIRYHGVSFAIFKGEVRVEL